MLRLLRLDPGQHRLVAVRTVLQGTIDPADRGAGGAGALQNVVIDHAVRQQHRHFEPLLHGPQLRHRTQIREKLFALVQVLQREDTPEIASEWCLKNGYPPFIKSLVENEDIKNDEYVSIFSQMEDYGEVSCVGLTTGQQIQSDVLFPMVENIMAGNDAQAELTKASEEIDGILATEK